MAAAPRQGLPVSSTPVDLILVAHNAFRRDLNDIDAAALSTHVLLEEVGAQPSRYRPPSA
jgi:hypothetical protein